MRSGAGSIMVFACSISLFVKTVLPDPEGPATIQVKGCFSFRVMTRLNSVLTSHLNLYYQILLVYTNYNVTTRTTLSHNSWIYYHQSQYSAYTNDAIKSSSIIIQYDLYMNLYVHHYLQYQSSQYAVIMYMNSYDHSRIYNMTEYTES